MTDADKPFAQLARSLDQMATVLDGTGPDQADLPTPCQGWTVHDLVDHVVNDLGRFTVAVRTGKSPDLSDPPRVEGNWASTFRDRAPDLLAAWKDAGSPNEIIKLPIGEVPRSFVINQEMTEFTVHAWDLVTATGQQIELEPALASTALEWARAALRPEFRGEGKAFGPEKPAPEGAPAYDRLAAFFGRDVSPAG